MTSGDMNRKRKAEDDLKTKPVLRKHKENETKCEEANIITVQDTVGGLDETPDFFEVAAIREKTLFAGLFRGETQISDIISFFKDVGQVVRVRLIVGIKGNSVGCAFVEFATLDQANKALQNKNLECLRGHTLVLTKPLAEETEAVSPTLFVGNLSGQAEISDIIGFFQDVGKVVHFRLIVGSKDLHLGYGFVEFASSNEAMKALQKKNGEYLHDSKIFLGVANKGATYLPPRFCIDHPVWYEEDYLQPIEEDKTPPDFAEEVLLVANLSPQTTSFEHIINFFKDVGTIVGVRLIVNHKCKNVGYGFIEFASAYQAKRALKEKNGKYLNDHRIFLMKGFVGETPDFVEEVAVRDKTLFVTKVSQQADLSDIINFFKDVGQVVHVRLRVNREGGWIGRGYVEFASADDAKNALKKNGEYLNNIKIRVEVFRTAPKPQRLECYIDHYVWYDDYLGRENLLLGDAAAVEGIETPELVDVRKKTLFVARLTANMMKARVVFQLFNSVGEVVRVRLIRDHMGEHVGCGFVEFASSHEAKKAALEIKNGFHFFVRFAEIARYRFRPNYNLAEKLWYEDKLRRKTRETMTNLSKKIIFASDDDE